MSYFLPRVTLYLHRSCQPNSWKILKWHVNSRLDPIILPGQQLSGTLYLLLKSVVALRISSLLRHFHSWKCFLILIKSLVRFHSVINFGRSMRKIVLVPNLLLWHLCEGYSGTSIIRTIRLSGLFSLVPIFSWILISCDLENSKSQKAQ